MHQRLAASTWWYGPRPTVERWAEMGDNIPRDPTIRSPPIVFHYTRRIRPKRVTSLLCQSPRHSTKTTNYFCKCSSGGELFATLCKIWPFRDLNSRLSAHEARALTIRSSRWLISRCQKLNFRSLQIG